MSLADLLFLLGAGGYAVLATVLVFAVLFTLAGPERPRTGPGWRSGRCGLIMTWCSRSGTARRSTAAGLG